MWGRQAFGIGFSLGPRVSGWGEKTEDSILSSVVSMLPRFGALHMYFSQVQSACFGVGSGVEFGVSG